ncbi:MAG: NAD(P)-binding domain-containing protein, partial [Actinomycetota bacterium]
MRVAIIGPGRVGTLLAVAGVRAGWRIVAVGGGHASSRTRLTGRIAGVRAHADPAAAVADADLVLLTVPDDAIEPVVDALVRADALGPEQGVVHV